MFNVDEIDTLRATKATKTAEGAAKVLK